MSILEKLKDLVSALEINEKEEQEEKVEVYQEDKEETAPPVTAAPPPPEEPAPEIEEIEEFPDYLDCTDTESELIWAQIEDVRLLKFKLAETQIQYEKSKSSLIYAIATKNKEILSNLESLRLEYGIPEDGYSVQLPFDSIGKVSFSKD
jgi:FtsZ-interacting cell division protein YlmF